MYNYDKVGDLVSFTKEGRKGFKVPSISFSGGVYKFFVGDIESQRQICAFVKEQRHFTL